MAKDVDSKVWEEKDLRIARESALKNVTELIVSGDIELKDIFKEAELQVHYIYNGCVIPKSDSPPENNTVKLAPEEVAVIEKVAEELMAAAPVGYAVNIIKVTQAIWKVFGKYPKNLKSVPVIVDKLKIEDCVVEDL